MPSIKIVNQWRYSERVKFGLDIEGPNNLIVGCSVKTKDGEIIDHEAKVLPSPGVAIWTVPVEQNDVIIFAIYSDANFENRLADTGWHKVIDNWLGVSGAKEASLYRKQIEKFVGDREDILF